MQTVKATAPQTVLDRPSAQPQVHQLWPRDDSVLALRELGQVGVAGP
jgi:hypothetical protein